jgi:hypothetical protein
MRDLVFPPSGALGSAVRQFVEGVFFDIARGRPVDGVVQPAATRVLMLRHMRRRWDREERERCAQVRADGERAGVRVCPRPAPWPLLAQVPPSLREAALAEPLSAFRARYAFDPYRPLGQRLGHMADRVRRDRALADALKVYDAAFPPITPRSHA